MIATPKADKTNPLPDALVVFVLGEQEFGLHISSVERIVRVVEITPLPDAPDGVLGVVNVQGNIIPVFDTRTCFRLPRRELRLSDHLIVAHTAKRKVGLLVDAVLGVVKEDPATIVSAESILPGLDSVEGVVKAKDDLILIQNLDRFLSLDNESVLHLAMKSHQ